MRKKILITLVAASAMAASLLAGCAATARDMLQEHQCMREASNRPDAVQRKAECQQRMKAEQPAPSHVLDT